MSEEKTAAPFASLSEARQAQAMARYEVLRPHLDGTVPLPRAAADAGVPLRTAERWLARYRRGGLAALARPVRSDAGTRRSPDDLVALIEGLGLKRPRSSAATIHRRVGGIAKARGWRAPSYGTVHAILARLDPAMVTLSHERGTGRLSRPFRVDPPPPRGDAQRDLASGSHAPRRPHP
jgi:putative transposase